MHIANNILKHHLRNCYFITGTAYAGKSTLCALLAERFHMLHCEENYGLYEMQTVADPEAATANFKACIARINSPEQHKAFQESGFFVLERTNPDVDTREDMLSALAKHFKLLDSPTPLT